MPKCPNCGQPTARTKDWACQWCGYPLMSGSYKEIPKTYKELKEEGLHKWGQAVEEETETISLPLTPVLESEAKMVPEAEPEPMVEPEAEVMPEAEARLMPEPEAEVMPEAETRSIPEPEAEVIPEAETKSLSEPEAGIMTEGEPKVTTEPAAEMAHEVEPTPVPEAEAKPMPTSPVVTAGELYSAFEANAVGADIKYKGKTLQVTGTVNKIVVKDTYDIYYVMLASAEKHEKWNVRCTFDRKHEAELKRLTTGQTVTIQGEYDGFRTNILLRDCALVL